MLAIAAVAWPALAGPALAQATPVSPAFAGSVTLQAWQLFGEGHEAQARDDLPTALDRLNRAIAQSPAFFPGFMDRGITYYKLQQFEPAAADFGRAIELGRNSPVLAMAYKLQGICYRRLNRPADAVRVYSAYLAGLGATDWDGFTQRGEAQAQAGAFAEARSDFARALALSPGNPKVLGALTVADAQAGDWARALDDAVRWRAADPNQPVAARIEAAARQHLAK